MANTTRPLKEIIIFRFLSKRLTTILKSAMLIVAFNAHYQFANAQWADTTLSNLVSPTKVKVNLLPSKSDNKDLGSSSKGWKGIYLTGSLYLDGAKFLDNAGTNNTFIGMTGNITNTGTANSFMGF